jgi:hypothetical protein
MVDTKAMQIDPATRAQIMSLRQAGQTPAQIADRLYLTVPFVQQVLANEPRRFKRGCDAGPGPAYRRGMGTL